MVERTPVDAKNLSQYGNPILEWSEVETRLAEGTPKIESAFFLGTTRPDGRPHSAGIGLAWFAGDLYFTSSPKARKARNLTENPAGTISVRLDGYDIVLEGEATRVTDAPILEKVAEVYREGGWPATVDGDAFVAPYNAPSAGPPPWHLYRFTFSKAIALRTEGEGATRWRF